MKKYHKILSVIHLICGLTILLFISCEEEEPTACFECERVIQTFDADGFLILRQEDGFTKCEITEAEMRQIEADGTRTESTNSGGSQQFFTTCTKQSN